jgi:hypothetical protein
MIKAPAVHQTYGLSLGPWGSETGDAGIGAALPGPGDAAGALAPPASSSVPRADSPGSNTGVAPFGLSRHWSSLSCKSLVMIL